MLTLVGTSTVMVIFSSIFSQFRSNDGFAFMKWINKFLDVDSKQILWMFTPYWVWLCCTFIGMCYILVTSFELFNMIIKPSTEFDPNSFAKRMPLFMILIWFTWFCSKQFSYTKQICDDYEYKYLLSMSYLSYRNEVKEMCEGEECKALVVKLLDSVIKNIATSPVVVVKADCHTPFAEIFTAIKNTFAK